MATAATSGSATRSAPRRQEAGGGRSVLPTQRHPAVSASAARQLEAAGQSSQHSPTRRPVLKPQPHPPAGGVRSDLPATVPPAGWRRPFSPLTTAPPARQVLRPQHHPPDRSVLPTQRHLPHRHSAGPRPAATCCSRGVRLLYFLQFTLLSGVLRKKAATFGCDFWPSYSESPSAVQDKRIFPIDEK
ncbi:small nuclear ribonucleoprotein-associated protein B'-like [Leucoraja erinacea]|uniref:small nuclear ribonucleoprotein-associated protein B'-like n=1 Tax=Leucoraja erinaceus TaxID=7782 RepID=UPI002456E4E6|nr:small nuclear ribonucleoprotein-associated protein B'-like [Leucoraja erinacea]